MERSSHIGEVVSMVITTKSRFGLGRELWPDPRDGVCGVGEGPMGFKLVARLSLLPTQRQLSPGADSIPNGEVTSVRPSPIRNPATWCSGTHQLVLLGSTPRICI
jgi:hypothetical protein